MKGNKLIKVSTSGMKTIFLLYLVVLRYWVPNMFLTFAIKDYIKVKWIYKLEMK
jgi:hypothetical protein